MIKRHLRPRASNPGNPSGATLVEVLMSLLILAIGVVPIFTLFPVSLLSSIRANQLTTTRLFADQIAATMLAHPEMVMGAQSWTPLQTYGTNTVITPSIPAGSNSPALRTYFYTQGGGQNGVTEPDPWQTDPDTTTSDNGVTWTPLLLPMSSAQISALSGRSKTFIPFRYVIDPYGMMMAESSLASDFGNFGGATASTQPVLRINCGVTSEQLAILNKFTSPDTWTTIESAIPLKAVTVDTNSDSIADSTDLTFPASMDMTGYSYTGGPNDPHLTRVVAISPDGRRSVSAFVSAPSSTSTVRVQGVLLAGSTSPGDYTSTIGQMRLEVFERRYTWLGTVQRESGGGANLQIAVCFNRSFRAADEQLYQYTLPTGSLDTLQVQWSGSEPYIVKGGYAFDAGSVTFRRIIDLKKSASSAIVVLDKQLEQTNGPFRVMFMPGILQVYEMSL